MTFDSTAGKAAVKVIHEAREAQGPDPAGQVAKTTVDFSPAFAFALSGTPGPDGRVERRVLIGRGWPLSGAGTASPLNDHPLVIDPDREATGVRSGFALSKSGFPHVPFAATDTTAYGIRVSDPMGPSPTFELVRMGVPDLAWKPVGRVCPATGLATVVTVRVHGGRVHFIALANDPAPPGTRTATTNHYEWWAVGLDGTGARRFGPNFDRVLIPNGGLSVSAHCGPVVYLDGQTIPSGLYAADPAELAK